MQGYEIWHGRKREIEETLRLPIPKITISIWLVRKLNELRIPSPDLIANGVDRDLFYYAKRNAPEIPTIGFVFANSPLKGGDIALKAIKLAAKTRKHFRVKAFSHHTPSDLSTNLENFTFIVSPEQSELYQIYSSYTGWLFPSREEEFGLPILEAMACGTPIIACPSRTAPEILVGGGGTIL